MAVSVELVREETSFLCRHIGKRNLGDLMNFAPGQENAILQVLSDLADLITFIRDNSNGTDMNSDADGLTATGKAFTVANSFSSVGMA